jgi:hypothetical protein
MVKETQGFCESCLTLFLRAMRNIGARRVLFSQFAEALL